LTSTGGRLFQVEQAKAEDDRYMIQPRSTAITEAENVSSVRPTPNRRYREAGEKDPSGSRNQRRSVAKAFARMVALSALTVSGCMTTSEHAREDRVIPSANSNAANLISAADLGSSVEPVGLVRLQSPADVAESYARTAQAVQPPLTDPSLPATAPSPAIRTAANDDSSSASGLSSIARNRRANRGVPNPAPSGSGDSGLSDLSQRLRDRIEGSVGPGEVPQFNYPDIRSEPGKRYHDLFGIDEEHDRFIFPWLVNLIFEDRWLLAEKDPAEAVRNQFRARMKVDIRDPDPDTANFPNGAYTLPKGRMLIENSPLGLYGASKNTPRIYQWEYLLRYGLTDNLELRIFSNGLTAQAAQAKQKATTGYSPLAFDFKANFWEENTRYHIPAMGIEVYLQTTFGSPAFNAGTQPSMNLLFDQSLPLGIGFEYNFGIAGVQNGLGMTKYEFNFAWSFQREVVKDFDIFVQGFYNESGLPRLLQFGHVKDLASLLARATIPVANVVGVGAIKTVNDRFAIFGSYNFGTTTGSPHTIALTGFALAF
jgi:hypothetical protein